MGATSMFVALFVFWLILSGKFDPLHLGLGAASAAFAAWSTRRLLSLPAQGPASSRPDLWLPWGRFLAYLPWLACQIVLSSIRVARVVLDPRMPISPRMVRFRQPLPNGLARLTLANSITLTPGTVFLDLEGDAFVAHALLDPDARDLEAGEGVARRVSGLFRTGKG